MIDARYRQALFAAAERLHEWDLAASSLELEAPQAEIGRARLLEFVRYGQPRYLVGWFHRELCAALEWFSREVVEKRSPRLLIAAPPQHGKSEIVSRRFPVWHLGRNPWHHAAIASYNQDFADRISRDSRSVRAWAQEWWPDLAPRPNGTDRVDYWEIAGGGSYKAVGVGGGLTGNPAHVLVIDDPLKDRMEADSKTIRESVWSWFCEAAYTRLAPGGGILVMATRWHEDDPSGRILSKLAEQEGWRVVVYPDIAEHDERFRKEGDALHPERYPAEYLARVHMVLGSRAYHALYRQRPTSAQGAIFLRDWLGRRFTDDPQRPVKRYDEVVISVDATFKGTDETDYVSMGVWGRYGWGDHRRLDQVRARMSYVGTRAALRDLAKKWRPSAVLIETKANGEALLSDLAGEIPGLIGLSPDKHGDKITRAKAGTPFFESGQVSLPADAPWASDYVEEHAAFPRGTNDDMVDDTSQYLLWIRERRDTGESDQALVDLMTRLVG